MVIVGYVGEMRSGKTLMMTYHLAQDYMRMRKEGKTPKIFSNYKLSFPHTLVSSKSLIDAAADEENDIFSECSIAIDEMHIFMDSRTSGSKRNRLLSYFLTQSGKLENTLAYSSQMWRQVDVRLRLNTSILYRTTRIIFDPMTGRYRKLAQDDRRSDFIIKLERFEMRDTPKGMLMVPVWQKLILDPSKLFGLYDTKQRIFMEKEEEPVRKKTSKVSNKDLEGFADE